MTSSPKRRDRLSGSQVVVPMLEPRLRRVVVAFGLIVAVFLLGVVGYRAIGGDRYTWLDAVYMTAITVTTTGFREVIDVSTNAGGQVFTIFLLIFGAGTMVYFTTVTTAFVVEGDLTQQFRRRRMQRVIQEMSGHYIVCGMGPTGIAVLRELLATARHAVAVDADLETLRRIEAEFPDARVIAGDFTDDATLLRAGIERADGIVVCEGSDKDSLVATVTARQLNSRVRVVARASEERAVSRLRTAGADAVVSPALVGGMRMASELVRPAVVSFLDLMLRDKDQNLRIEEVRVPAHSPYMGRPVGELDLRSAGVLLLAVRETSAGRYIYNPAPDYALGAHAQLIVMGAPSGMHALRSRVNGTAPTGGPAIVA